MLAANRGVRVCKSSEWSRPDSLARRNNNMARRRADSLKVALIAVKLHKTIMSHHQQVKHAQVVTVFLAVGSQAGQLRVDVIGHVQVFLAKRNRDLIALGCQYDIAKKLRFAGGIDYICGMPKGGFKEGHTSQSGLLSGAVTVTRDHRNARGHPPGMPWQIGMSFPEPVPGYSIRN